MITDLSSYAITLSSFQLHNVFPAHAHHPHQHLVRMLSQHRQHTPHIRPILAIVLHRRADKLYQSTSTVLDLRHYFSYPDI